MKLFLHVLCFGTSLVLAQLSLAAEQATKSLLEMSTESIKPTSAQVSVAVSSDPAAPGIDVKVDGGSEEFPGLDLKAPGGAWDLSGFGHVAAKITNTGEKPLNLNMRIDNAGKWQDNPWNTEQASIKPGETRAIKVIFGYAYGGKPSYALKPEAVINVKLFSGKSKEPRSFRIVSIEAGGEAGEKPPVDPNSLRIVPPNGVMVGPGIKLDPQQVLPRGAATAGIEGDTVKATFTKPDQMVLIKPLQGRWRLADFLEVRVKLRNDGANSITPMARVESPSEPTHNRGPTDWAKGEPIAPGASGEVVVPFGGKIWDGAEPKKTGNSYQSNVTTGVAVRVAGGQGEQKLTIESIVAGMPPTPTLADWLGQRPPREGAWTQTFEENFDGPIDPKKWEIYTENFWDKRSHFSRDNVIVEDGVAKLRFEHKRGHHSDDPSKKETDYATGFLSTYGRWTQKYGYFEARTKLPRAPGMWPAFWMMPDRGADKGEQWKRADTKFGGMEFDILEHLSRWGPNRYNVALHWDGYQKEHKQHGSEAIYVQPDKDGFITSGVLWEPGKLTFYANGEVVAKWENERISSVPMYVIFTAVSGGWDNDPIDNSKLPSDFVIDYVRCWQRNDLASSNSATASQPSVGP